VHCTPVVMSYLLVGEESAVWFVDQKKVGEDVAAALIGAGVYLRDYDEIEHALDTIEPGTGVMVDGNTVPSDVYSGGTFNALPYLRRDSLGVIATGRHILSLFPYTGSVYSTVTMKVIEKI